MDRDWYINECLRQLNDTTFYRRLDSDITSDILTRVQFFFKRLHNDGVIDDKTKRFLIQADPKPGRFYILPKIHKHGNPGRPIVSSNGHPQKASLSSLTTISNHWSTKQHPSSKTLHISSTNLTNLDTYPVTLSLSSLYTNIPHNEGIDACRHYLNTRDKSTSTVRTETLCDLIRMILTMNTFEFNNTFYIQTHGTAMGTRMAPSYANLFLAKFETDAHASHQPHTW